MESPSERLPEEIAFEHETLIIERAARDLDAVGCELRHQDTQLSPEGHFIFIVTHPAGFASVHGRIDERNGTLVIIKVEGYRG
jgi:hypothetical protein